MAEPLALSLFDFIDDHIEAHGAGRRSPDDRRGGAKLMTFCDEAFQQVFAALDHDLEGFTAGNRARVNLLLRRQRRQWSRAVIDVVRDFLRYAKRHDELESEQYDDAAASWWLQHRFMPELLDHLLAFGSEHGSVELRDRIEAARTAYSEFESSE